MKYFLGALKKYTVFSGRARRSEFWFFCLFQLIFTIVAIFLDLVIGINIPVIDFGLLSTIYVLALIIPSIAVSVRRLHDTGRSGWMIFINLIPIAGLIWYLVLMIKDSNVGDNKYGPNPKLVSGAIAPTPTSAPVVPVQTTASPISESPTQTYSAEIPEQQ